MNLIPLSQIITADDRQRKSFPEADSNSLRDSILTFGLLHPPVVRRIGLNQYLLIAGERRFRAISEIAEIETSFQYDGKAVPPGRIPVTLLGDLDELALREAELHENIIRLDLTWQERSRAIADLANLRKAQAEADPENHAPVTLASIASEIAGKPVAGSQTTAVSEALIVAKHLDDPDVAKASSVQEAFKVLRKKQDQLHRAKLSAEFLAAPSTHFLRNGSAFSFLPELGDGKFKVILTDPPYGVGADTFGEQGQGHNYKDDAEYAELCAKLIAKEGFRVAQPDAHCYMFLDIGNFPKFSVLFALAGWEVWPTPLIWSKLGGILPRAEVGPRKTYEAILFAWKGKLPVARVADDVLTHRLIMRNKLHGAQKPVSLYIDLLSRSCRPGDEVLDPFAGSGTIFPAANKLQLRATGCERDTDYYHMGMSRMHDTEAEEEDLTPTEEASLGVIMAKLGG